LKIEDLRFASGGPVVKRSIKKMMERADFASLLRRSGYEGRIVAYGYEG
jgi:hypothetical protein